MFTKAPGWSTAASRVARFLALSAGVSALVLVLAGNVAQAQAKKGRDRVVELNKKALESFEAQDYEGARDSLTKALKEAKQSGLEDDKMTARTYLHLGAVYWAGSRDRTMALQNFTLAKRIRPDIQMTPSLETPELRAIFDLAGAEPGAAPALEPGAHQAKSPPRMATPAGPAVEPTAEPEARSGKGRNRGGKTPRPVEDGEPELPTNMTSPLMCTTPEESPPNLDLALRCALKPGIKAKSVQLHYRVVGEEAFKALDMRHTAKGWYAATLPSHVMKGGSLQVYFSARGSGDAEVASNGHPDSPSIIEIRKQGEVLAGEEGSDEDPMARLRRQAKLDKYEAGLHRRRAGAVWIGFGGGMGWGFAPAGELEWEKKENGKPVQVSAVSTVAGLCNLLPEVGLMLSDNFAIAAQLRYELIQQQQGQIQLEGAWQNYSFNRAGAPYTSAAAGLLRAIWYTDVTSSGNLRLALSGNVGIGFVRFPIAPSKVRNVSKDGEGLPIIPGGKDQYLDKTDTRPVGAFLFGPSGGLMWNLSRHFALDFSVRLLLGAPNLGMVLEGALSAQLSFGGKGGPTIQRPGDDEEDGPNPDSEERDDKDEKNEKDEPAPAPASDSAADLPMPEPGE